jgi:hypothetical protein
MNWKNASGVMNQKFIQQSHLQNSIGDCKECQGTTSVVPKDDQIKKMLGFSPCVYSSSCLPFRSG